MATILDEKHQAVLEEHEDVSRSIASVDHSV